MSSHPHCGEITKIPEQYRVSAMECCVDLAKVAVQAQGIGTLLLPSAAVTAVHEAGHAVLSAAAGKPYFVVRIWSVPTSAGGGFSGECDFSPGSPAIAIDARARPREAIEYACVALAGWAAEMIFAIERFKYGSSLDELTVAGGLIRAAAESLGLDPKRLWQSIFMVTSTILQRQSATVTALQRRLVAEHRVRGRKLSEILDKVPRYAVVDSVIAVALDSRPICAKATNPMEPAVSNRPYLQDIPAVRTEAQS